MKVLIASWKYQLAKRCRSHCIINTGLYNTIPAMKDDRDMMSGKDDRAMHHDVSGHTLNMPGQPNTNTTVLSPGTASSHSVGGHSTSSGQSSASSGNTGSTGSQQQNSSGQQDDDDKPTKTEATPNPFHSRTTERTRAMLRQDTLP